MLRLGLQSNLFLKRKGDNVRIDWGYAYLAAKSSPEKSVGLGDYYAS